MDIEAPEPKPDERTLKRIGNLAYKTRLRGQYIVRHVGMNRADRREFAVLLRRRHIGDPKKERFIELAQRAKKAAEHAQAVRKQAAGRPTSDQ